MAIWWAEHTFFLNTLFDVELGRMHVTIWPTKRRQKLRSARSRLVLLNSCHRHNNSTSQVAHWSRRRMRDPWSSAPPPPRPAACNRAFPASPVFKRGKLMLIVICSWGFDTDFSPAMCDQNSSEIKIGSRTASSRQQTMRLRRDLCQGKELSQSETQVDMRSSLSVG